MHNLCLQIKHFLHLICLLCCDFVFFPNLPLFTIKNSCILKHYSCIMKQALLWFTFSIFISCGKQETETPTPTPQQPTTYTISITAGDGGSVSSTGGTYEEGTQLNITATPSAEYVFTGWSNGSTENPISITVNSNLTLSANFEKKSYALSVFTAGQGSVDESIVTAGKQPTDYTSGTVVRLTANPSDNWNFSSWSGAVSSTDNPIEITVDSVKTVTATFVEIQTETSSSTTASSTTTSSTGDSSTNSPTYTTTLEPFANPDSGYGNFTKKAVVFDVPIYGTNQVDDAKMRHAANIMAEYLDNDEDGQPDNPLVVEALKTNHGFLLVWKNESDLNIFDSLDNPDAGQDLGADETIPAWHTNGRVGQFDASLEEVLHLITHIGYHNAYPNVFGEVIGSSVGDAMDIARGGQFTSIPATYPAGAWYTYDDESCDYACQVTEYVFWALTSILGAHENRLDEIDDEWTLNTPAKVQQTDTAIHALLTDPQYHFPTVLPDGQYNGQGSN